MAIKGMKAISNKEIVAESYNAIMNEDYYYFPIDTVPMALLKPSRDKTISYLEGTANDFHVKTRWKKLSNGA